MLSQLFPCSRRIRLKLLNHANAWDTAIYQSKAEESCTYPEHWHITEIQRAFCSVSRHDCSSLNENILSERHLKNNLVSSVLKKSSVKKLHISVGRYLIH